MSDMFKGRRSPEKYKDSEPVLLDVPFYRQTQDFTCGPACAMMAMAHYDYNIELDAELEIDVWRESHPGEVYGTIRYGLAHSMWRRGFGVKIFSNTKELEFLDFIKFRYKDIDLKRLDFFYREMAARCKKAGIPEEFQDLTLEDIDQVLQDGQVPILLTNAKIFTSEDVPHWIVVAGLDMTRGIITVNNPLGDAQEALTFESFQEGMGYRENQVMLVVLPAQPGRKKGKK